VVLLDQLPEHNAPKPLLPVMGTILKPVIPIVKTILKPVIPIAEALKRKFLPETGTEKTPLGYLDKLSHPFRLRLSRAADRIVY
jgi:hypothetical protein